MPDYITRQEAEAMVQKAVAQASLKSQLPYRPFKIFGLNGSHGYAKKVANHLKIELTSHEEKLFPDGENFAKPCGGKKGNVRGHNVFVIQSLYSDDNESVSDKFVKLCWMVGALKDASAHEVTVVIPHLAWARQDRKTQSREPITTKYVANLLQKSGIDRALFIDVHNLSAIQNAFDQPIDNLEAKNLFADWCAKRLVNSEKIAVLTPDTGGMKRADMFRGSLVAKLAKLRGGPVEDVIELAVFDKIRIKDVIKGGRIIGDIDGADVIVYDDMISTGGTMRKACKAVIRDGGKLFAICATHGLFCGEANERLREFDTNIVVTDTVDPWRLTSENKAKISVVSTCEMVASAIERIHYGTGSISELLSGEFVDQF